MSSSTIIVLRCDRCGHEMEFRHPEVGDGWGRLAATASTRERARGIGAGPQGDDLCPGCIDALFAWWATPGEVAQPAPPPPAAPRPRPVFTIEDRSRLAPLLRAALVAQVEEASAAYRAAPTTVLHPEIPPVALAGIDERADCLGRQIIEQLEANQR